MDCRSEKKLDKFSARDLSQKAEKQYSFSVLKDINHVYWQLTAT